MTDLDNTKLSKEIFFRVEMRTPVLQYPERIVIVQGLCMVNAGGAANLIVAVIELARRDAVEPKGCRSAETERVRRDAQAFLVEVVQSAAAECLLDVVIPCRRPAGGSIRWQINETEAGRRMWRSRNEKNYE